jgi:hypothetical protein
MPRVTRAGENGPAPVVMQLPPWPGVVAHTRAGDRRIWLDASAVYLPDQPVDLRCSCTAGTEIALDRLAGMIVFLVHHQPGCQAIQDKLQMAGVR